MSNAERLGFVPLSPYNRHWSEPSCTEMQTSGDLSHGLLPRDHFRWSGYSRLELSTHQESVDREMESDREDDKESWICYLLFMHGSLDRNFKVGLEDLCLCFLNKEITLVQTYAETLFFCKLHIFICLCELVCTG